MAEKHVEVIGLDGLKRKFKSIDTNTAQQIKAQVLKSGLKIESAAKDKAPVDTGRLRAAIDTKISNGGFTYEVYPTVTYAAALEFGTRAHFPPPAALAGWARRHGMSGKEYLIARAVSRKGTKKQPFLFPAYEAEKDNFINGIKDILKGVR
jgi:HK97 gp10 family phage protein